MTQGRGLKALWLLWRRDEPLRKEQVRVSFFIAVVVGNKKKVFICFTYLIDVSDR